MTKQIFENSETLCVALAKWIEEKIADVLLTSDRFTFLLSGGSTPKRLYEKLSENKNINWEKVHFFWGDERFVPLSDERSNANMAYETLLSKVDTPKENIHIFQTNISIEASIKQYDDTLHQYFKGFFSFDLSLLGMGDDGHTLSLFPGGKLITDNHTWVATDIKPGEDIHRITLMPSIVNQSKYIVLLVSGKGKAAMLKNVLELDPYYPVNLIESMNGETIWFLDKDAAQLLS
ncbi:MAG: 6-phosphogluconolactonase [Ginsengibacter sp.]